MRIAIVGAGSLGTILGAYIGKTGYDITLVDAYEAHVVALNEHGATVVGTTEFTVPVKACLPENMEGIYDYIIYMVKQTFNASAIPQIVAHISSDSMIITAQNGLPELELIEAFGENRVLGCPVGWGATFKGPGISELTSNPERMTFELGRLNGVVDEPLLKAQKILESMCPTHIIGNIMGSRWSKLLINATFSGLSTVMGCTYGEIIADEAGLACAQFIANECIQIAAAAKIEMEPIQGFHLDQLMGFRTESERLATAPVYPKIIAFHLLLRASMLQDIERGLKCEIDAINGIVSQMGIKHSVSTPVTDQVVEIIRELESGIGKPEIKNIKRIILPTL